MLSQVARLSDCLSDCLASIFSPITDFSPICLHHCKHLIKVSHRIALCLCCTRLAPIFDRPEVELQCSCNFFRSVLSGDVDLPSSFRQPHSVHCNPGSPYPAHITSSQSPSSLPSPITASTFHSRLKTHLFHKSFPP